jgi:hypothetical protein
MFHPFRKIKPIIPIIPIIQKSYIDPFAKKQNKLPYKDFIKFFPWKNVIRGDLIKNKKQN